jgi:nucleotide-binding universal stress UspA family protein
MSTFKTIVAAIDFSGTSDDAVRTASEIARDYSSRVHLVHVVPEPLQQPWSTDAGGIDVTELRKAWFEDAERRLARIASEFSLPERVSQAVIVGPPAGEITRYAKEHGADLIVMGTHGYGPVRRFIVGSVADRVVREASCPVLLVPHRDLRAPNVRREAAFATAGEPAGQTGV